MSRDINPFIRAHGASPGPLMRPLLTGFISGELAGFGMLILLFLFRVLGPLMSQFGGATVVEALFIFSAIAGILYGKIYRRAANDTRGGWIFGSSTGFILWMVNPVIWLPWFGVPALFVGRASLIFMLSHAVFGALLGILFPWIHKLTTARISKLNA